MPQRNTVQTEVPDSWIRKCECNVRANPVADRAWEEIKRAGLEEDAYFLLWGYAGGAKADLKRMHQRTEYADRRMKAAMRAARQARTKTPKRASDSNLFNKRASENRQDALKADWPMPSPNVRTLGDELALASNTTKGRSICLDAIRNATVKAAGKRSPVTSPFYFLFLLREYAARHGVELGLKRLSALANCADDSRELDEGTLGHYLRDIPQSVIDGIRRDTLPKIPLPTPQTTSD